MGQEIPAGYVVLFYWTLVALGAALSLGTGAALVRYARTGRLPDGTPRERAAPSGRAVRGALLRCLAGFALAAGGLGGVLSASG